MTAAVEDAGESRAGDDVAAGEGAVADRGPGLARQVDVVEQGHRAGSVQPAVKAFGARIDRRGEAEEFLLRRDAADGSVRIDGLRVTFLRDRDDHAFPAALNGDLAFAGGGVLVVLVIGVDREDDRAVSVAVSHGRGHPFRGEDDPVRVGGDHHRLLGRVLGGHAADVGAVHGEDGLFLRLLAGCERNRGEDRHDFNCVFHIVNHFFLRMI